MLSTPIEAIEVIINLEQAAASTSTSTSTSSPHATADLRLHDKMRRCLVGCAEKLIFRRVVRMFAQPQAERGGGRDECSLLLGTLIRVLRAPATCTLWRQPRPASSPKHKTSTFHLDIAHSPQLELLLPPNLHQAPDTPSSSSISITHIPSCRASTSPTTTEMSPCMLRAYRCQKPPAPEQPLSAVSTMEVLSLQQIPELPAALS